MKNTLIQKLALYLYNNFLGNFLGFIVGMASTGLVSHFFATKSIKNLWGLTTRKTLVDKQTFSMMEWAVSILIGFIVFEIVSKSVKKKLDEWVPSWKKVLSVFNPQHNTVAYAEKDAAASDSRSGRVYRDVQ